MASGREPGGVAVVDVFGDAGGGVDQARPLAGAVRRGSPSRGPC